MISSTSSRGQRRRDDRRTGAPKFTQTGRGATPEALDEEADRSPKRPRRNSARRESTASSSSSITTNPGSGAHDDYSDSSVRDSTSTAANSRQPTTTPPAPTDVGILEIQPSASATPRQSQAPPSTRPETPTNTREPPEPVVRSSVEEARHSLGRHVSDSMMTWDACLEESRGNVGGDFEEAEEDDGGDFDETETGDLCDTCVLHRAEHSGLSACQCKYTRPTARSRN